MRVYVEDISLYCHPVKYYTVYILKGEHQLYNVVKQVHESILGVLWAPVYHKYQSYTPCTLCAYQRSYRQA